MLKAIDEHAALLRAAAADVGNDHRLGANEAPHAILSIYRGDQLGDVLNQLIATGTATHSLKGCLLYTSQIYRRQRQIRLKRCQRRVCCKA